MKKILCLFLCVAYFGILTPVQALTVPEGTEIPISVKYAITSRNPNQTARATINEDVIIDNTKIFERDGKVTINIGDYDKASAWGNGGELTIVDGYAYDVNGNKHKISVYKHIEGKDKNWVKVCCCFGIVLLPLLLFGFVRGNEAKLLPRVELNATIDKGFEF